VRRSPCGSRTTPSSRVAMRCSGSRRRRLSLSRPRPARNLALPSPYPCGWRGRAHRKHRLAPASSHVLGGSWGTGATSLPWGTTHPSLSLPRPPAVGENGLTRMSASGASTHGLITLPNSAHRFDRPTRKPGPQHFC